MFHVAKELLRYRLICPACSMRMSQNRLRGKWLESPWHCEHCGSLVKKRRFPALYWDLTEFAGLVSMILVTPLLVSGRHFELFFTLNLISLCLWIVLWSWLRPYITPVQLAVQLGCRKCGYDLTGNTSGACPECGAPVIPSAKPKALQDNTNH
jgi:hypothetical protein